MNGNRTASPFSLVRQKALICLLGKCFHASTQSKCVQEKALVNIQYLKKSQSQEQVNP